MGAVRNRVVCGFASSCGRAVRVHGSVGVHSPGGTRPPSGSFHVGINAPFRLTSHWKRLAVARAASLRATGGRARRAPRSRSETPCGTRQGTLFGLKYRGKVPDAEPGVRAQPSVDPLRGRSPRGVPPPVGAAGPSRGALPAGHRLRPAAGRRAGDAEGLSGQGRPGDHRHRGEHARHRADPRAGRRAARSAAIAGVPGTGGGQRRASLQRDRGDDRRRPNAPAHAGVDRGVQPAGARRPRGASGGRSGSRRNPGARGRRRPLPGRAAGRLRLPARPALPLAGRTNPGWRRSAKKTTTASRRRSSTPSWPTSTSPGSTRSATATAARRGSSSSCCWRAPACR